MCVSVRCVCVCVRERERERESVCVLFVARCCCYFVVAEFLCVSVLESSASVCFLSVFTTFFTCGVSMHGRCYVWQPCLIDSSGAALSCFTLSRLTVFPAVSLITPEDSFSPLFQAILYSLSWARKHVNSDTCGHIRKSVYYGYAYLPIKLQSLSLSAERDDCVT